MKRLLAVTAAIGLIAATAVAEVSVTMDIASAYVFRGITAVDDLVVQPGIEASGFGMPEEYGSIALGTWGSTAPFSDTYDNLHETDWYAVYSLPQIVSNLDLSVGITAYQYAGSGGEQEINLGAGYLLGEVLLGATANFMIDDEIQATKSQKYIDFFADFAPEVSENFDVSIGALASVMFQGDGNSAAGLDDGFNHYELNGTYSRPISEMWSIGASLIYVGQFDDNVLPDATAISAGYDKGLLAMFSIGCDM